MRPPCSIYFGLALVHVLLHFIFLQSSFPTAISVRKKMAEGDLPPLISAKIQLSELAPEDGKDLRASTDKKRWQRIVRIFELQGCDDGKPEHRVPALVRKDELRNVLARSGFLDGVHKQPPKLIFGHALFFLRGRHRLVAAAEFLAVKEQWWTVDLYDQGECTRTLITLHYETDNKRRNI